MNESPLKEAARLTTEGRQAVQATTVQPVRPGTQGNGCRKLAAGNHNLESMHPNLPLVKGQSPDASSHKV
jgi:hypothetical protein